MKKKWIMALCTAMLCTGLAAGCGNSTDKEAETEETMETVETETAAQEETEAQESQEGAAAEGEIISDVTVAGWHIVVEDMQINASLENVSVDLGYSGAQTSSFVKEAGEGNTFCLLKMNIEKDGSQEVIDWASMKLTDTEGNEYTRTEDEFITDLGMTRMSGTALNFGTNEGWIAFEIKEGATGLQLTYPFEEETYTCDLPDVQ